MIIELRPSRSLIFFLVFGHVVACFAALTGLELAAAAVITGALAVSLWGQLQIIRLKTPGAVLALRITSEKNVEYRDVSGTWHVSKPVGQGYATPLLMILSLRNESGSRRRVILFGDSAGKEDLRRLRSWMRWGPRGSVPHELRAR